MLIIKLKTKLIVFYIAVFVQIFHIATADEYSIKQVSSPLFFDKAIKAAQINDPWLTGNIHKQRAIESLSIAAKTLPDPKVSMVLANLPTDGFDFGQEAMTQAKVGVSQVFPRGNTLKIKSQQLKIQTEAFPFQRIDRSSRVAVIVGGLWLDAFRVQQSIVLMEKNKSLFEQVVDIASASYSSTLGKTRQQDILQAQIELTRLEDRLEQLAQEKSRYEGELSQWLNTYSLHNINLGQQLPHIDLLNHDFIHNNEWFQVDKLTVYFLNHPSVIAIEKQVYATKSAVELAKQKYEPEWGVNASYGYRSDDPMGRSRADLFSVGITFDLPIFTENKQDQEVQAAISQTEAIKTEKTLLLRQLLSAFSSAKGRFLHLKKRQALYESTLLPKIQDQVEASLTAYTHDDGSLSDVIRARMMLLNTEIEALTLNVEEQKTRLTLNYFFVGSLKSDISRNTIDSHLVSSNYQELSHVNETINRKYADIFGEIQ